MKLSDVIENYEGELICDGSFETLEYCTSTLRMPFLSFMENPKFVSRISKFATCIFCKKDLVENLPETVRGIFVTENPKELFHAVHNKLSEREGYKLEKYSNKIGDSCIISPMAHISSHNVTIGDRVIIEENVIISDNVIIGNDCIIHSGAVVGGKAFTFARASKGKIIGLNDVGRVIIGDRVEIFSLSHIAKGILPTDVTFIDDDVKIDALVHIGHGVKIGKRTLVAASALLGGNTIIGEDSWIGVNATVSNRIIIGNGARVSLGAVVTQNVRDNETVTGNFAIEHSQFINKLKEKVGKDK
ncbi:MAG: UDP-3-O-(3-hydroxymyristoyl)glucosamine N-acyltransferase [Lachnospiraceae bacterium]|nr:UDP-3-O-(3-hydroxymyristoyl)glucosamine N-acyltransferase [Lachnospiraceae bacterium]